jgi:hypothetical protein
VTGTNVNDTTLGANNLAAQYAQLVNSSVVISAADRLLKPPGSIPTSAVTGGAVSAQNLVSIQATASSPQQAQARAAAVTTAFIEYVTYQVSRQATHYQQTTAAQLRPIDVEIASTQAKLKRSPTTARFALQQTLDTLLGQRASAQANIAESSVAGRPSVQLASQAGLGGQTAPKPTLYAVVGFVIGLLIIARLVVYNSGRRRPVSSGKAA